MGYDPSGVIGTGPRPGTTRFSQYVMDRWGTGTYGIFNPASVAGGGPSLHADGRAFDAALNANDPAQLARGDHLMHWAIANHEKIGLQEILWRGYLWSYQKRHLGLRFGYAQAAHMNHVHLGQDYNAANNWTTAWLEGATGGSDDMAQVPQEQWEEVHRAIIGDGDRSIYWNARYLRSELLTEGSKFWTKLVPKYVVNPIVDRINWSVWVTHTLIRNVASRVPAIGEDAYSISHEEKD